MEKSVNYNFNLPNSANDEIADINQISDNFRTIDRELKAVDDNIPVIDQTYNPLSENAQSGTAVAEAVEEKQDKFATVSTDDDENVTYLKLPINVDKNLHLEGSMGQEVIITNIATPTRGMDAANKNYVDTAAAEAVSGEAKRANNTFANALKGSVSGEAVTMKDVSPVEHDMGVKVRGKNLVDDTKRLFTTGNIFFGFTASSGIIPITLPKSTYTFSVVTADSTTTNLYIKNSNNTEILFVAYNTNKLTFTLSETQDILISVYKSDYTSSDDIVTAQLELGTTVTPYTPYISDFTEVKVRKQGKNLIPYPYAETTKTLNGITFTDNGDGTITANGTATAQTDFVVSQKLTVPEGTYILSNYIDADKRVFLSVKSNDGSIKYFNQNAFSIKYGDVIQWVYIRIQSGTVCENTIFYPQLELGTTVTDYEPGITPIEYTPNTDGTVEGVTSLYPTTTLTTDTAGAIIDCEYNRDMNKAYSDLLQRIAALETVAVNNV